MKGDEEFDLLGLDENAKARQQVTLVITRPDRTQSRVALTLRLDTPAELNYVRSGGILPYVLAGLAA